MRLSILASLLLVVPTFAGRPAAAEGEPQAGGRVNNLKVLSDKIDDVTTPEAILGSFLRPGMSDAERAKALWIAAVKYRHQTIPPNEFLAGDWEAHDPVKLFNVYGYCMCCCSSALLEALNRLDGREARGRILNGHSVPEVRYGGAWHMYDASLITFFPRPSDGVVASVDEISEAVQGWYAGHPGIRGDATKLVDVMRGDGWSGWKSKGPALLADCPYYRAGYFPAGTHGWDATMVEYDRRAEVYEYGYHVGHRALFSLRPGESFIREAGNRGLHVNMDADPKWGGLAAKAPEKDLVYVGQFLPGYRGGVVGNGTHRYAPRLEAGDLALGAERLENLAAGRGSPALHPERPGRPAVAVIPMLSPYVYLGGRITIRGVRSSDRDRISVAISTNNGRSYRPLLELSGKPGRFEESVDLNASILRRYAYWLKLEMTADTPERTGIDRIEVENDFQHAPRTLPWLGKGKNTIRVASDPGPALATRTIACRITTDPEFRRNETAATMGLQFENLDLKHEAYWWKGGVGRLTVPIEVPGDLRTLRWSAQVRARGEKDLVKMLASTDDGGTWREVGRMAGPTQGRTGAFRAEGWPPGVRKALLRFELSGNNTVGVLSLRVDADYADPLSAKESRPFRVVHRWTEGGVARVHEQDVARLPASYEIRADGEPEMVSVTCEMPASR